jgi:precorrin-2/cobalt-factor-2 C20-methyltransferase
VLFVPTRREGAPSYALAIAQSLIDVAKQQVVSLVYPAERSLRQEPGHWSTNADCIAALLRGGLLGAFLTEGDPLLYSTFVHAMLALRERHPAVALEVVPGIWSGSAAAALLAEPLVDGRERLAIIPATYGDADLASALAEFDTLVLLKPPQDFGSLRRLLAQTHASAVYVERVGRPEQTIVRDLSTLPDRRRDYFSLLIVRRRRNAQ